MAENMCFLSENGLQILIKIVQKSYLSECSTPKNEDWERIAKHFNNLMDTQFKAIELKKFWDLYQIREKSKLMNMMSCSVKLERVDETGQRSGPLYNGKAMSIQEAATTSSNVADAPPDLGLPISYSTDFSFLPFSMKFLKSKATGSSTSTEMSEDKEEDQWIGWPTQLTEEQLHMKAMKLKLEQELRHVEELHCQKLRHKEEVHQLQVVMFKEWHQALMKKENRASCY